jgi:hypothetical protein
MKSHLRISPLPRALLGLVLALTVIIARTTPAAILWTGANTNFTQSPTTLTDELIPGAVSLTRNYDMWLYNPDAGDTGPALGTPTDTEWAFGLLTNYVGLSYATFDSYRNGYLSGLLVGNPMVVHLINEDIYLSLTFSNWPSKGGFFAYTRSTPAPVTITNPPDGAVFAAPANVKIWAGVAFPGSSVTNVAFFANTNPVGSVQSAPFVITTGALAAGSYALTAVATAAGASATSAVVNITVISPVAIVLSSPGIANSQFAFDYTADPGLSYVVQNSSNLVNWVSLVTNVATINPAHFTDNLAPNGASYYRVGRLPNP